VVLESELGVVGNQRSDTLEIGRKLEDVTGAGATVQHASTPPHIRLNECLFSAYKYRSSPFLLDGDILRKDVVFFSQFDRVRRLVHIRMSDFAVLREKNSIRGQPRHDS
jgi:hypothetical protein